MNITPDMLDYDGDAVIVTVNGRRYRVTTENDPDATPMNADCYDAEDIDSLASGDVVCPECGASRSVGRIADHMASEHSDDDELGDPRPPGNLPYYPDESHYYFYHEPPFDENHYRYHTPAGPNPACVNCRWLTWDQPREETGNE